MFFVNDNYTTKTYSRHTKDKGVKAYHEKNYEVTNEESKRRKEQRYYKTPKNQL